MDIYLDIFVREMADLENDGIDIVIDGERHDIKLFAICSCVDSMARAPMQGLHQCGGYSSCNWCYIRGNWVEFGGGGAVKQLTGNGPSNERTHESMMADVHESHETGFVTRGVNHTSRLLVLRFFDIVRGCRLVKGLAEEAGVLGGAGCNVLEMLLGPAESTEMCTRETLAD
ncbi:hypothetical protein QAD02_013832 [Eretmocerus hayati]|uniref:Uncharacterized protein n=1 Tax=Eretmocerus hayati TaxID=131215 RepID=A0ACC2P8D9_9HYME|nr:hypothetical protein QAD02_013832 [Eretmocerus hayati]